MASLYENELLPSTSEAAIRQFQEKYLAVISAAPAPVWADRFISGVNAPRVTYPLSAMSVKFRETKEKSGTFKGFEEKSFDLKVVQFDAGLEVPMLDLSTNVFAARNWARGPERFRIAERRHYCQKLATLLEAGTSGTTSYDDLAFFSTAHLANPFDSSLGTFSNYNNAGVDPASTTNLTAEITSMMAVKDENGDKLGVMPDEIWLPTGKFQAVSNLLNQNLISNGESNPMLGKLKPVHVPELTDANDWYLVDSKMMAAGYDPMIAATYAPAASLGLRYWDESSDFFKETGKIKVSQNIWCGVALLFPHAIRRVAGA